MKLIPLERHITQTLLGVSFWDRLTNQIVAEGLQVKAQRLSRDRTQRLGKPVIGQATPSRAIAFFGLMSEERSNALNRPLENAPFPEQWVAIDVADRLSRFLPLSFMVQLPLPSAARGLFRGQGKWLSTSLLRPEVEPLKPEVESHESEVESPKPMGIQLWSAPTRAVPPGQAAIYAQIVVGDGADATPAAYAVIRVRSVSDDSASDDPDGSVNSETFDYYGMADSRGTLLLLLPYPTIPEQVNYSPLDKHTFPIDIAVQYAPQKEFLSGSDVPNLEDLLNQPQVDIAVHKTANSTLDFQSSLSAHLRFRRPLILGTALSPGSAEVESVLRIQTT